LRSDFLTGSLATGFRNRPFTLRLITILSAPRRMTWSRDRVFVPAFSRHRAEALKPRGHTGLQRRYFQNHSHPQYTWRLSTAVTFPVRGAKGNAVTGLITSN